MRHPSVLTARLLALLTALACLTTPADLVAQSCAPTPENPIPCCGNGVCNLLEDGINCPEDCDICGDGICGPDETEDSCPNDCASVCIPQGCAGRCGEIFDCSEEPIDCGPCDTCGTPRFSVSPPNPLAYQSIMFTADSTTIIDPPAPHWQFGDGTEDYGAAVSHIYEAPGTYNVVLTATEAVCQSQRSTTVPVTVRDSFNCDVVPSGEPCCGDGVCQGGERPSCPLDCPLECGDGICAPGEDCPGDCCFSGYTCDAGCAPLPDFEVSNPNPSVFEWVTFTAKPENIVGDSVNWDFGDETHCDNCPRTVKHQYTRTGSFPARLTATENVCFHGQVGSPRIITVGAPPMRDDAQMVSSSLPACLRPGEPRPGSILVRNTGGTTWANVHGQHLALAQGAEVVSGGDAAISGAVVVPPWQLHEFPFNLASATAGTHTLKFQMQNVHGYFGEPLLHRLTVASDCPDVPPPTGDFTCTASVRTQAGEPMAGVPITLSAFVMDSDGTLQIAMSPDQRYTDTGGLAHLALTKPLGVVVNQLACGAEGIDATTDETQIVSDPVDVPVPTHIDLNLVAVPTFNPIAYFPGLKSGYGVARLYQRGAYDKPVVVPTPFDPNEQTEKHFTHEKLAQLFAPFLDEAWERGYDVWLMKTKTGQNIHEQAAEFAQLIDLAAARQGPEATTIVAGYSLGGLTARLATARYQADHQWATELGLRWVMPVSLIGFGDAPLAGANASFGLQDALWSIHGSDAEAAANLNSCGAQQLLQRSYPRGRSNHRSFFETGAEIAFETDGAHSGVYDRYDRDAHVALCDSGPAVFSVGLNGDGFADGIPMVAFSDGTPAHPLACYGGQLDLDATGRDVCDDLPSIVFPPIPYPFAVTLGERMFKVQRYLDPDVEVLADADDIRPGSRLSLARATQCKDIPGLPGNGKACAGIEKQYVSPVFIPLDSALPAGAPFVATWHASFNAVHGKGVDENLSQLFAQMDAVTDHAAAGPDPTTVVTHQPADALLGSAPVTVTYSNVYAPGETHLQITDDGPVPLPRHVHGSPLRYYKLSSTVAADVSRDRPIEICIDYGGVRFMDEEQIKLFQYQEFGWADITAVNDPAAKRVCGNTTRLWPREIGRCRWPFAIFEPVNEQPVVVASGDLIAEADGPTGAAVTLSAAGSYDPDLEPLALEWKDSSGATLGHDRTLAFRYPIGQSSVTLSASDPRGGSGSHTVSILVQDTTSPQAVVSVAGRGVRTIRVAAADAVGVVRVVVRIDGVEQPALTQAPYEYSWNTGQESPGLHLVDAVAWDEAGNAGIAPPVEILVGAPPPPPPPPDL